MAGRQAGRQQTSFFLSPTNFVFSSGELLDSWRRRPPFYCSSSSSRNAQHRYNTLRHTRIHTWREEVSRCLICHVNLYRFQLTNRPTDGPMDRPREFF
jgi:hypothetical protein